MNFLNRPVSGGSSSGFVPTVTEANLSREVDRTGRRYGEDPVVSTVESPRQGRPTYHRVDLTQWSEKCRRSEATRDGLVGMQIVRLPAQVFTCGPVELT